MSIEINSSTALNNLLDYTKFELEKASQIRDEVRQQRILRGYVESNYFLDDLINIISNDNELCEYVKDFEIDFITRADFAGDIVFKSTKLIRENKDIYLNQICPKLKELLLQTKTNGINLFDTVEQKGIYVNAKFVNESIFCSLQKILSLGDKYGETSVGKGKDIIVDYSSPNAAKRLHAGHIRSTIIGHVLSNIYEANGYTVHRINFLNDWGGVGNLIEGLRRWENIIGDFEIKNDMLGEIYSVFRKGQKYAENEDEYNSNPEDIENIKKFFGNFYDHNGLKENYLDFKNNADIDFKNLESGKEAEFFDWQKIIKRSLEDFNRFYNILDIHQDYLLGESLYSILGKELVKEEMKKGNIIYFDENQALIQEKLIKEKILSGEIKEESGKILLQEIKADIGGYVIILDNFERYVVLKGNESTIYATRDLASIKFRIDTFNPEQIIYEVGQEQIDHFNKLFESAHKLYGSNNTIFKHIYHGFYVNEETKKKLSSRDGASNIMSLIFDTIDYFYHKYDGNNDFLEEEKKNIALSLGVGSIVFNDIRKDKKTSVGISSNKEEMFKQFEESGGAYIIYTSCRAKSILRKYNKDIPDMQDVDFSLINDIEVDLIKKLLDYPQVVTKAARDDDPVKITEYLGKLASSYNSFYNAFPVLKGDFANRVILTKCVAQVIDNALKLIHIKTLDRI